MELIKYKCIYCGKEEFRGFPHYLNDTFEACLDCAFTNNHITKNEYLINAFYSEDWNNIGNYNVVLKDSTDYKQIICINDSIYEVVNITKDKYSNIRNYPEYNEWRLFVFERDKFTCQHCNQVGGRLNAHHIKSYKDFKDIRTVLDNGITLCYECHKQEHKRLRGLK